MNTHFFGDSAVLLGRSLKHITRSLDTIITTALMPIAFMLLFVYVLGGAIKHGTGSYVTYLLPGILLITISSGISRPTAVVMVRILPSTRHETMPGNHFGIDSGCRITPHTVSASAAIRRS